MTPTSQQLFRTGISNDPFVLRDRASDLRSRELAMMARRFLRALRQVAAPVRRRIASVASAG